MAPICKGSRGSWDPRDLGAKCSECPFAVQGAPVQPVPAEGPKDAQAVLVGEAPNRDEAENGRPFTGPAGQVLDEELLKVGLLRHKLLAINAVACRPQKYDDALMRKAVACCASVFAAQLANVPATAHFLAMGRWAVLALTGQERGVMGGRGFLRPYTRG